MGDTGKWGMMVHACDPSKQGTVVHTCDPSTWELEAERSGVQGHVEHFEFEASLGYTTPEREVGGWLTILTEDRS